MLRWKRWQRVGGREGDDVLTTQELSQIYWLNKEITMWQQELDRLESQSRAKGTEFTDVKQHGSRTVSKVESQAVRPEIIREEILALKQKAEQELSILRQYINGIDDSLVRQIIEYKYAQRLTWEETAARIGGASSVESLRKTLQRFLRK